MTNKEYKIMQVFCDDAFNALQSTERHTGTLSTQSIVARAYWWGAETLKQYCKEVFLNVSRQATHTALNTKGSNENEN